MSEKEELVKRLDIYMRQQAPHVAVREAGKLLAECRAALTAQPSAQEPVAQVVFDVYNGKKSRPQIFRLMNDEQLMRFESNTKLYIAPSSGVREGMLRAAEICMQTAKRSDRDLYGAVRCAAGQINAEGQLVANQDLPDKFVAINGIVRPSAPRPGKPRTHVSVPVELTDAMLNAWFSTKSLVLDGTIKEFQPRWEAMLRAATGKESEHGQ